MAIDRKKCVCRPDVNRATKTMLNSPIVEFLALPSSKLYRLIIAVVYSAFRGIMKMAKLFTYLIAKRRTNMARLLIVNIRNQLV